MKLSFYLLFLLSFSLALISTRSYGTKQASEKDKLLVKLKVAEATYKKIVESGMTRKIHAFDNNCDIKLTERIPCCFTVIKNSFYAGFPQYERVIRNAPNSEARSIPASKVTQFVNTYIKLWNMGATTGVNPLQISLELSNMYAEK